MELTKSRKLMKRFVRDFSLPVPVIQHPYIDYYLELYGDKFDILQKLSMLQDFVERFDNNEDKSLEYYNSLRERIIKEIKESEAYKEWNNRELGNHSFNAFQKNFYNKVNVGKSFISIDLKKANFQVMKNQGIVQEADYKDFIWKYTDLLYFVESKYFRQVLFGNLNPKRQQHFQKRIMGEIMQVLPEGLETVNASADEIIMIVPELGVKNVVEDAVVDLPYNIHIEAFDLKQLGNKDMYVREFDDGSWDFKKVPGLLHAQAYKFYKGLPVVDYDMLFVYEKQIAKFIERTFDGS